MTLTRVLLLFATLFSLFTVSCGSGGGGSSDSSAISPTTTSSASSTISAASQSSLEGTFIDSPVAGLDYTCGSHTGVTDDSGRFVFDAGDVCTFAVGDIVVGSVTGQKEVTPYSIAQTTDIDNVYALNIARFLQSLDSDPDDDKITIPGSVRKAAVKGDANVGVYVQNIKLTDSSFDSDGFAANLIPALTSDSSYTTTGQLKGSDVARTHMKSSLKKRNISISDNVYLCYHYTREFTSNSYPDREVACVPSPTICAQLDGGAVAIAKGGENQSVYEDGLFASAASCQARCKSMGKNKFRHPDGTVGTTMCQNQYKLWAKNSSYKAEGTTTSSTKSGSTGSSSTKPNCSKSGATTNIHPSCKSSRGSSGSSGSSSSSGSNSNGGSCPSKYAGTYLQSAGAWSWRYKLSTSGCSGSYCEQTLNDWNNPSSGYGWHCSRSAEVSAGSSYDFSWSVNSGKMNISHGNKSYTISGSSGNYMFNHAKQQ